MAPEIIIAVITAASVLGAAVVAAVPALLTVLRRTRTAVENQGEETRAVTLDALDAVGSRLQTRFDARLDDVRDDLDEVREGLSRVREWQAGHDAEHLVIGAPRPRGDTS
ncbi:hypothetical protein CP967_31165 [Streptomyces nitrosporeus]|uniref:Uncharacterized protein n=1 Tax=Streptomyces nitrosporeus TaxID=28894 RepID=A0A5J6FHM9_9ACTN|nr:hypothetical protein [Streptomyces nitrosporeus]QEU75832.1 hypothetical protein CP967_31165 [Streptomyces nitrosporeus]GGY88635.1 hypothetical protein GCM10010327_19190 [Streptomyces nitrosporeus]